VLAFGEGSLRVVRFRYLMVDLGQTDVEVGSEAVVIAVPAIAFVAVVYMLGAEGLLVDRSEARSHTAWLPWELV